MHLPVEHDPVASCFQITVDGQRCALDYRLDGKRMTIQHTRVPADLSGRGLAAMLTREALDTARSKGWEVVAECSYARHFIERHPEYQPLLAPAASS